MTQSGGKMNKSLKAWVAFVKKVQKEEKLSYKDAIHRAKVRKDKGEKWMKGGAETTTSTPVMDVVEEEVVSEVETPVETETMMSEEFVGGKRRRTVRRSRGKGRSRTARRGRSRSARRH